MVALVDTTLRDGVQSLWSSRISADQIIPIARAMDRAGYEAIDFMASVQFEVSVKHLKENPWERVRAIRNVIRNTPLIAHVRSRSMTSFDLVADEVIELMIQRLAANGFRRIMILDALHDVDNLKLSIDASKKYGLHVSVILFYTISPIHTDEYYANKASELARLGADSICIRDPSGLLTPDRVRQLIPIIRKAVGGLHLQLKSHCTTGLAEACYIEAIRHGVNSLFTASTPLAYGPSVPSVESIRSRAREEGIDIPMDGARLQDIDEYFTEFAKDHGRPLGTPVEVIDQSQYEHQVPGGMISFLKDQLRNMHIEHRLPEVLKEFPRVRADFGYPVVVTPISQLIGVQAVLNVVGGERYKSIPVEVRKYVLGYYGKPEAPINPELLDRVSALTADSPPPATPDNALQRIRDAFGPFESDDDLLLHVLFRPEQLKDILRVRVNRSSPDLSIAGRTLVNVVKEALQLKRLTFVNIRTDSYSFCASNRADGITNTNA